MAEFPIERKIMDDLCREYGVDPAEVTEIHSEWDTARSEFPTIVFERRPLVFTYKPKEA